MFKEKYFKIKFKRKNMSLRSCNKDNSVSTRKLDPSCLVY